LPAHRAEARVVDDREVVATVGQHGLDRLVQELERVAEAEVARPAGQRDPGAVADVEQVRDLALLDVRVVPRSPDDERALPAGRRRVRPRR
jgi:hypothetical protein